MSGCVDVVFDLTWWVPLGVVADLAVYWLVYRYGKRRGARQARAQGVGP